MRCEDQIFRTRMNNDVVVSSRREIRLELSPVIAAVVADEKRALRPQEQYIRLSRILREAANRGIILRETGNYRCPCLAEIRCAEQIGGEVTVAMRIKGHIRRSGRRCGCDNPADEGAILHTLDVCAQLRPCRSAIS